MFTRRQPVIEMLDRAANALRAGALALLGIRASNSPLSTPLRRPRRALSLTTLIILVVGLALLLTGSPNASVLMICMSSFLSGVSGSYGALVDRTVWRDERERSLALKSHLIGLGAVQIFATIAFFYFAFSMPSAGVANLSIAHAHGLLGAWYPHSPSDWTALGFSLQALEASIALIWANWSVPRDQSVWDDG